MLITFTGAQNTGKTTLLNALQDLNGDKFDFIPEVTRLIKREYDLPINEDGGSMTQFMIVAEHMKNIFKASRTKPCILDRCILDGYIYSLYMMAKVSWEDIQQMNDVCILAHSLYLQYISKYDIIFYTEPEDIEIENDGERSINKDFRDQIIRYFETNLDTIDELGVKNLVRLKGSVSERLKTVKSTLAKFNIDIKIK